jgi:hypothetical protein
MIKTLYFLLILIPVQLSANVLIITHCYNRPEFIEMHHRSFSELLLDDHEYVVFNDAPNEDMKNQIEQMCKKLGVRCFRIPQEIHTRPYLPRLPGDPLNRPNIRHANNTQYSLDILGFDHDGIVFLVDSDMFLIRPLSIEEYMKDLDIVAMEKGSSPTVRYLCAALCFLDMRKLPDVRTLNFNCGFADGQSVDSGGWTHYYLKSHPELRKEWVNSLWSHTHLFLANSDVHQPADNTMPDHVKIAHYENFGFRKNEIGFLIKKPDTFEFFFNLNFIHYHAGSNHDRKSAEYHAHKLSLFNELIESAVQNKNR